MRVLRIRDVVEFLNAPAPAGLGMSVTLAWVRKMAEPDARGRRCLPFFKARGGKTSRLVTTDEALRAHFRHLATSALREIHGPKATLRSGAD
jgi:hypothetical protein